jgi:hypothetical protein
MNRKLKVIYYFGVYFFELLGFSSSYVKLISGGDSEEGFLPGPYPRNVVPSIFPLSLSGSKNTMVKFAGTGNIPLDVLLASVFLVFLQEEKVAWKLFLFNIVNEREKAFIRSMSIRPVDLGVHFYPTGTCSFFHNGAEKLPHFVLPRSVKALLHLKLSDQERGKMVNLLQKMSELNHFEWEQSEGMYIVRFKGNLYGVSLC